MVFRLIVIYFFCVSVVNAADKSILIMGDSLSASYGIPIDKGWVSLLQDRLIQKGYSHTIINASISGETTRGARSRLPQLLEQHRPDICLIELGGNDGLRGISIEEMQNNLSFMIEALRAADIKVIISKIKLPPNYGPVYIKRFESVYPAMQEKYGIILAPFILDSIADKPDLMQADGIHPVAVAQPIMLDNIWPTLLPLLAETEE